MIPLDSLLLLPLAIAALAGSVALGRHGEAARPDFGTPPALSSLGVGLLAGLALLLAAAGGGAAADAADLGPRWNTLWRADLVGAACAGAAFVLFRRDATSGPWQLPAIGLSAAIASGGGLALEWLDLDLAGVPSSTGLVAAVWAGWILSPSRRAQLMRLARSAAVLGTGDGILLVDAEGRVLESNRAAREAVKMQADARTAPWDSGDRMQLPERLRGLLENTEQRRVELRYGSERFFEAWIGPRQDRGPLRGIRALVVRDMTPHRRDKHRLIRLAHYDSLTGLANRRLFVEHFERTLEQSREVHGTAALFYIDLDHFKEINDSLGHGAGDELLRVLAHRFLNQLRAEDFAALGISGDAPPAVSRLAGDEFALVVPGVGTSELAEQVAQRILRVIASPIQLGEQSMVGSASVGVALFPRDGSDVETLVKHADSALYAAKRRGRSGYAFYEHAFDEQADRIRLIEQGLRRAIENDELRLHYQPKVDLATGTVAGFEALLRWTNPDLGSVGPKEFIPVAEDRGLIVAIGAWCLEQSCRQLRAWRDEGFEAVPVSVNVSSAQFVQPDLRDAVTEALRKFDLDPQLLELELTERLLLQDGEETALCLRDLRSMGVRIALDDFGTGYSALTYLNRFPLDVLKMDRGFIRDIEFSSAATGIASAVVSMAHSLGLSVVAEGIDSEEQVESLRAMDCDQVQGFLYSAAVPPRDAKQFLARAGEDRPLVGTHGDAPRELSTGELEAGSAAAVESVVAEAVAVGEEPGAPDPAPSDWPRALVLDDDDRTLGPLCLRLVRLGIDLHHASDADEAHLLATQERSSIRLLLAPPCIDVEVATQVLAHVREETGAKAPFIVIGEEPDAETRARIRSAGVTSVLWSPFEDDELRFVLSTAMSPSPGDSSRRETRVPVNEMAWVRAGDRREAGVMSSLSSVGAFIEMPEPFPVDTQLRLEFELPGERFRVFAKVLYVRDEDPTRPDAAPGGIGVCFYGLDRETGIAIAEAVEERATRYRP